MENKKIKNATECELDGIKFRSKQERAVYKYLRSIGITPRYEEERFLIWDRDMFSVPFYDRYGKVFQRITRKPTAVHYTPDFTFNIGDTKVILEVKGFKNDATPYKIKMFRDCLERQSKLGEKLCYAIVYTIKDLKFLLKDLQVSSEIPTFAESKLSEMNKSPLKRIEELIPNLPGKDATLAQKFLKERNFEGILELTKSDLYKLDKAKYGRLENIPDELTSALTELKDEVETYMLYLEVPDNSDDEDYYY